MELTTKEICTIVNVARPLFLQQRGFGAFSPSIKKVSRRPGRASDLYSLTDAYRVALFNDLQKQSGFNRETVAKMLKSVKPDDLQTLISLGVFLGMRLERLELFGKMIEMGDRFEVDRNKYEAIIKKMFFDSESTLDIGLFLVFASSGGKYFCVAAIEDDPRLESKLITPGMGLSACVETFKSADSVHVFNFAKTMIRVDSRLFWYYPEKAIDHAFKHYTVVRKIAEQQGKICLNDIISVFSEGV